MSNLRFLLARMVGYLLLVLVREGGRHAAFFESRGRDGLLALLEACKGEQAVAVLRTGGASVGRNNVLAGSLTLHNAHDGLANLTIGNQCHIGRQVLLDLADEITFGDRVTVSMRCTLLTHTDVGAVRSPHGQAVDKRGPINIGDDVYIGAGCTILAGVRIGNGAVVGAGALVNRDVPAGGVYAGVPARPLRGRG